MTVFNLIKRIAGRVQGYASHGLDVAKRIAGKVNHVFHTAKHIGGKLSKIPLISKAIDHVRNEYPMIKRAEEYFHKADQIQQKVNNYLNGIHLPSGSQSNHNYHPAVHRNYR